MINAAFIMGQRNTPWLLDIIKMGEYSFNQSIGGIGEDICLIAPVRRFSIENWRKGRGVPRAAQHFSHHLHPERGPGDEGKNPGLAQGRIFGRGKHSAAQY
jgi:hypothetical protein